MKKKESDKKRFVIYTRCSTDDQSQGQYTTLDAQAHHCKNMLDAFGYELADFGKGGIVCDDGFSGKNLKRPGIKSILDNVKNKRFDGIIFFRLDRLTRNPRDLYTLIDLLKAHDIDFISVRENLDSSTAIGRVVIGILGLLSAFERELTGERVKASAIARVRQGKWVGGSVPFGYKLIDDGPPLPNGRQPHKLVIDEETGPKLLIVWEMAADNRSLTEIGHELTRMRLTTAKGNVWRKQGISAIIKSPFYKGYLKYAGEVHKGHHPAIVDEDLWEEANKMLVSRLPRHRFLKKPRKYDYMMAGLLKCGACGSYFICTNAKSRGNKFFYYICGRSKQNLGCKASRLSATAFDAAIIDYFRRASKDQDIIVKAIGDAILDAQVKVDQVEKDIKKVSAKLKKARNEADKLLELAMGNSVSQGKTFKTKMTKLDDEINKLEDNMDKLQAQKSVDLMSANSGEFLHSNIKFAMKQLEKMPPEAQKNLLRTLIKEIVVHEDSIELKMYIGAPDETMSSKLRTLENHPENKKRPTEYCEALNRKAQGLPERHVWLPMPYSHCKNSRNKETMPWWQKFSVFVERVNKKRVLMIGSPPEKPPKIYESPLTEAYRYRRLIDNDPFIKTQADIARELGITRARVSQVMKLLSLAPKIQETLLTINDPKVIKHFSERRLRQLLSISKPAQQIKKFNRINKSFNIQ